jgi:hypothetical protein
VLIYQIEVRVPLTLANRFEKWLPGHAAQVVASGNFAGYEFFRQVNLDVPGTHCYVVQYRVAQAQLLDDYLSAHAPRLRQEALELFQGQLVFERRVLNVLS